jgi:hypothetical protein
MLFHVANRGIIESLDLARDVEIGNAMVGAHPEQVLHVQEKSARV